MRRSVAFGSGRAGLRRRLLSARAPLLVLLLAGWLWLQARPLLRAAPPPPPPFPPPSPPPAPPQPPLTVATGANSAYYNALVNLVGSVRYWCPECRLAVFNLGLSAAELATVRGWCNATLHWGDGYTHGDPNTYAFKALAVAEAVQAYGTVLWLDAGSTVAGPLLSTVLPHLAADGHFLVQGQDNAMLPWVHPGMMRHFGVTPAPFEGKPSYSGNTIGFVNGSVACHAILEPWVACALNASCVTPQGHNKGNHRYDQAALSVIAYSSGLNITPHTELLAAEQRQLQPCHEASAMVVWTSRGGESCYTPHATPCAA